MGRMPDAHAVRRTKDRAAIIPETVETCSLDVAILNWTVG